VQSLFLLLSYSIPLISGTFADRFGFKKVLIISYLAYLPSILLLIATKSFSGSCDDALHRGSRPASSSR